MGPLFVLGFWGVAATVLSVVGGAVLSFFVRLLTRRVSNGRKRATTIAALLPAAGFAYLFCCIMVFSAWSLARGRDMGWGDSWDTAILGNYNLMMIDVTDHATLYNHADKKVSDGNGSVSWGPGTKDVIEGVRRIEVQDPYIIGAAGPDDFGHEDKPSPEDRFFVMDTRSNERIDYSSLAELEMAARKLNAPFALESVDAVYEKHRYSWGDFVLVAVFAVPPLFIGWFLVRALWYLRRRADEGVAA
jgi:hypothetical protein